MDFILLCFSDDLLVFPIPCHSLRRPRCASFYFVWGLTVLTLQITFLLLLRVRTYSAYTGDYFPWWCVTWSNYSLFIASSGHPSSCRVGISILSRTGPERSHLSRTVHPLLLYKTNRNGTCSSHHLPSFLWTPGQSSETFIKSTSHYSRRRYLYLFYQILL